MPENHYTLDAWNPRAEGPGDRVEGVSIDAIDRFWATHLMEGWNVTLTDERDGHQMSWGRVNNSSSDA